MSKIKQLETFNKMIINTAFKYTNALKVKNTNFTKYNNAYNL